MPPSPTKNNQDILILLMAFSLTMNILNTLMRSWKICNTMEAFGEYFKVYMCNLIHTYLDFHYLTEQANDNTWYSILHIYRFIFFTSTWLTHGYFWATVKGNSLTTQMFINSFWFYVRLQGYPEHRNELFNEILMFFVLVVLTFMMGYSMNVLCCLLFYSNNVVAKLRTLGKSF